MTGEELDLEVARQQKQIANIGERFGSFLEGGYFPSLVEVLTERFRLEVVAPYYHWRNEQTGKIVMVMDGFGYSRTENVAVTVGIKEEYGLILRNYS